MLVSEIFYTRQGEGVHSGVPSLFVRTSGCNLRCIWCDTPYTSWQPEGTALSVDAVLAETERWPEVRHIVVTGGEPLVQRDLPELVDGLRERGRFVVIETAGTVYDARVKPDFFSISPKLRNSYPGEEHESERALHTRNNRYSRLPEFLGSGVDYQLKFVIQSEDDAPEILALVERFDLPRRRVLLMPEGVNAEQLEAREPIVARICEREGYRYTGRLHIETWGNRRGT